MQEALSWRLASELVRRHPRSVRLLRGHPGGGQSDVLWLIDPTGDLANGDVRLNRGGTIQVLSRFDGRPATWEPTTWLDYLLDDPRTFLRDLEAAAGLTAPASVPSATPRSLTYRILASLASQRLKTVHPLDIEQGFHDADWADRYSKAFAAFPQIDDPWAGDDFRGRTGYSWWFVRQDEQFLIAVEQESGRAWTPGHEHPRELMEDYVASARSVDLVASSLLRRALLLA